MTSKTAVSTQAPTTEGDVKTWFITGGSPGGFGMAYADAVLERGGRVVLTVRRPEELNNWAAQHGDRVLVVPLDVTDTQQIQAAVAAAEARFGSIDVLVNNAGRGWQGSVEGADDATVRRLFDLNFFAVTAVIRAVLPGMRARRHGWIVNMSSVGGLRGVLGFGYYSAAKFAIEGLSDTLRQEVEHLGIQVLTVEPGAFRTQAYAGFRDEPVSDLDDYLPLMESVHEAMLKGNGQQAGDPDRGVRAVLAAMSEDAPPQRLVLGNDGFDAVTSRLEAMLAEIRQHESLSRGADFPPAA